VSTPADIRLFECRDRLIDDLGGVYSGHESVRIRDWDDWDTWDDETAEMEYAAVTDLIK